MTDKELEDLWHPVKSVIDYHNMEYDEAVTIGGQFGKLKTEIRRLQKENKKLKDFQKQWHENMFGED